MTLVRENTNPVLEQIGTFVSYPCSGRTWIHVMLDELGVTLRYTHDHTSPRAAKLKPFERKNHCKPDSYRTRPVVFLLRDPRDTVVSAYFHATLRRSSYSGDISDFIRHPLHGIRKIICFHLAWITSGPRLPAFMAITYEELSADPFSVIRKIEDFLHVKLSDKDIRKVICNNTFEKMQRREIADEYREQYGSTLSGHDPNKRESFKIRRGKVGGFVDYLSPADIDYCNTMLNTYKYFETLMIAVGKRRIPYSMYVVSSM